MSAPPSGDGAGAEVRAVSGADVLARRGISPELAPAPSERRFPDGAHDRIGADSGIEVSLFIGPREEWDVGALAQSGEGASRAGLIRGVRQLRYAIDDVLRGVDHGIRGFLVADAGLLELLADMQADGQIPGSVVWKVSAMLGPANS